MCCCGDCLKNTVADQSAALHALGFPMQFYPASLFAFLLFSSYFDVMRSHLLDDLTSV